LTKEENDEKLKKSKGKEKKCSALTNSPSNGGKKKKCAVFFYSSRKKGRNGRWNKGKPMIKKIRSTSWAATEKKSPSFSEREKNSRPRKKEEAPVLACALSA